MARRPFGGGGDAIVLNASTGRPMPFASGTAWTQRSGGSQVTDLADTSGQPLAGLTTDALGAVAPFLGPVDGRDSLWIDFGHGRYLLLPTDVADRVEELEEGGGGDDTIGAGIVVAKGDLLAAIGPGAIARLPVGASGRVLTADPASASGMSWQAPLLGGVTSVDMTLTTTGNVSIPAGVPQNGYILKVKALASGGSRNLVFNDAFILTTAFASRTFSISSGKVFVGEAEYSSLAGGWVITQGTFTTSGEGGGGSTSLSAGADTSISAGATFSRTATEPSGTTITSRSWTILTGPTGQGTTIGTAAALSWVPGSTVSGSTDLRSPVFQEMAFEFTSTAENSTTDWTGSYDYCEDILDGRGYTGGLVGFTSATADMLALVEYYQTLRPTSNPLAAYIDGLEATTAFGDTVDEADYGVDGGGASGIAASELGAPFLAAWADAATNDPLFRQAQRDLRQTMYFGPALAAAIADGVGPLGLLIYYDTIVNHGPGEVSSGDGSFDDIRSRTTGTKPISGGNQRTWLVNFKNVRSAVLTEWGDNPSDGRIAAITSLLPASPNFQLTGTVSWSMYGEAFSFNRPNPPADSTRGIYTLRYTASPAGSDDVAVTVT